jgi:two-component system sensor histidine kinase/response regulator
MQRGERSPSLPGGSGDSLSRVLGSPELQLRVVHCPELLSALQLLGGDAELLKELAELFLESCPKMLQDIRVALQKRDAKALEIAAHLRTGSVGNSFLKERAKPRSSRSRWAGLAKSQELRNLPEISVGPELPQLKRFLAAISSALRIAAPAAPRIVL